MNKTICLYRRAKADDVEAVLELNEEFLQYSVEKQFEPGLREKKTDIEDTVKNLRDRILHPRKNFDNPLFVTEKGNKIIGFVTGITFNIPHAPSIKVKAILQNIFITEKSRGEGIGSNLLNKFISKCKNNKNNKVIVEPYAKDSDAIGFYIKMGFSDSSDKSSDSNKIKMEKIIDK